MVRVHRSRSLRLRRRKPSVDFDAFGKGHEKSAEIIRFPAANPDLDPETAMAQREIRSLSLSQSDPDVNDGVIRRGSAAAECDRSSGQTS